MTFPKVPDGDQGGGVRLYEATEFILELTAVDVPVGEHRSKKNAISQRLRRACNEGLVERWGADKAVFLERESFLSWVFRTYPEAQSCPEFPPPPMEHCSLSADLPSLDGELRGDQHPSDLNECYALLSQRANEILTLKRLNEGLLRENRELARKLDTAERKKQEVSDRISKQTRKGLKERKQ